MSQLRIDILDSKPFSIDGKAIKYLSVRDISYRKLCDMTAAASRAQNYQREINRLRMIERLVAVDTNDQTIRFDEKTVLTIPAPYAAAALDLTERFTREQGDILSIGDGALSPVLFRFGTPVKMTSTEGDIEISEIEFQAKTYGDIENVLAAADMESALVFIRDCGTPVISGEDKKLMSLPQSVIDQISAEDGMAILQKVMPSFLQ